MYVFHGPVLQAAYHEFILVSPIEVCRKLLIG